MERARHARQLGEQNSVEDELRNIINTAQAALHDGQKYVEGTVGVPVMDGSFTHDNGSHISTLQQDEYIELMRQMEEELYKENIEEEIQYLESLDEQAVEDMYDSHFPLGAEMYGVVCPVCREHWMVEWNGELACPSGHIRLQSPYEGRGLDALRNKLIEIDTMHSTSCGGRGVYTQEKQDGVDRLMYHCPVCQRQHIVI